MRGWRRHWELEPERRRCRGRSSSHPPIRRSWCCLARTPLASSPRGCADMEGRWSPCRRGPAPPTGATTGPGRTPAAPWYDVAPSLGFPGQKCSLVRARLSNLRNNTGVGGRGGKGRCDPGAHGYGRMLLHGYRCSVPKAVRSTYNWCSLL